MPFLVRWPGVVEPGSSSRSIVHFADVLPTALDLFGADATGFDGTSLLPLLSNQAPLEREHIVAQLDSNLRGELPIRALRTERFKYILNLRPGETFESNDLDSSRTWPSWKRAASESEAIAQRVECLLHRPLEELYDLREDPHELRNLAHASAHVATRDKLRATLRDWMKSSADPRLEDWPF